MNKPWRPYLAIFWRARYRLLGNAFIATAALGCSVGLLALSGWFLTATALAGMTLATAMAFNFFTPGALVRFFAMGRTAGRYGERVLGHALTLKILAEFRGDFFKRLIPFAPGVRGHQAELLQRMQQDIDALDHLYLRFFAPIFSALILLLLLLSLGWWLLPELAGPVALVLLLTVVALAIPYRKGKGLGRTIAQREADFQVGLYEYLGQLAVMRSFAVSTFYLKRVERLQSRLCALQKQLSDLQAWNRALSLQLPWILLFVLFYVAPEVSANAFWLAPQWACVLFLFIALQEVMAPLPDALLFLGRSQAAVARLDQACADAPVVFPKETSAKPEACTGEPALVFRDVSFGFTKDVAPLFTGLSLKLDTGSNTALVGPSGIGKSTLIGLLARWFNPVSGAVILAGLSIEKYSETELRRSVAIMPQQVDLLSGTLRENLMLAAPAASDEQLLEVLQRVELEHLAASQKGLACMIGPGGRTLSGGERRRIGIARILLSSAPFYVLDEPTEGLDLALERRMLALLQQHVAERTLLLISHRPQALALCSKVLRLDERGLEQRGHEMM